MNNAALAEESLKAAPTAASTKTIQEPQSPRPTLASSLVKEWAALRKNVGILGLSVVDGHRSALGLAVDELAARCARTESATLLEDLAENRGLSWTAISKMLGVTIPALRKWRKGEAITGENRGKLARLVAFLDLLVDRLEISDPASWLEIPILQDVPFTRTDVYAAGRIDLLLEFAEGIHSPERLLDLFHPNWRTDYPPSNWAVFRAADGQLSVKAKEVDQKLDE